MNRFILWLLGYTRISISGASPEWCLNKLHEENISFWDLEHVDEFTVQISVFRSKVNDVLYLAERAMCTGECTGTFGVPNILRGVKKRPVLVLGITLILLSTTVLPNYVWFYSVEGNTSVPTEAILRAVQDAGVRFGTRGKEIVPQTVKNRVLGVIPELSWLTVTQSGGCAKIIVREKTETPIITDRRVVRNMVAIRDGIVEEISVLDGSPMVKKGQAVVKGDTLISGFVDVEYKIRATSADGEVFARTSYEIDSATPAKISKKTYTGRTETNYYLILGNNRIKISRGSGILPYKCDKMTKEYPFTLPGGLTFPVSLVKEVSREYICDEETVSPSICETLLKENTKDNIIQGMQAGQVLEESLAYTEEDDLYKIKGTVYCREMIGKFTKVNDVRMIYDDGKNY